MKIGIIVAMEKELELFLPLLENMEERTVEGRKYFTGNIGIHTVALMKVGIGKVNAALNTSVLLRSFSPDWILNSGVAGGADSSMHVLDLLVADAVAYHDVWCGPGTKWGAADGCEARISTDRRICRLAKEVLGNDPHFRHGLICSGDIFVSKQEEVKAIKSHFPDALAVDMESGAIAQVCSLSGVPFNVIRVISDTPGEAENISQYENFWTDAPRNTFKAITSILHKLA